MRPFTRVTTKRFRKDVKQLDTSEYDLGKLEKVIDFLVIGNVLEPKYHDHALQGKLKGIRECHIQPDWLLLYSKDKERLILHLLRTGTHRDVLGIE